MIYKFHTTTGWSKFFLICRLILNPLTYAIIVINLTEYFDIIIPKSLPFVFSIIIFVAILIIPLVLIVIINYFLNPLTQVLASYLYITINLRANISIKEAKQLSPLFNLNNSGKWYPMSDIKRLPKKDRRSELIKRAKIIYL
jgi:hypothetical protein